MSSTSIDNSLSKQERDAITSAPLPPLDGTYTLDQLYDWHRISSGHLPCLRWIHNGERGGLTWEQLGSGIDNATALIKKDVNSAPLVNGSLEHKKQVVVAVLSTSDVVTYTTFLLAMERLTHPDKGNSDDLPFALLPFPLSIRNSPVVVAHLLRVSNARYVYVSDGPMRDILNEAMSLDPEDKSFPKVFKMPTFADFYSSGTQSTSRFNGTFRPAPDLDTPAMILHSSGSTAFPKAITQTHRNLLEQARHSLYGGMGMNGQVLAVVGSPAFHAMGIQSVCWAAATLVVRVVPTPHMNFQPPTPVSFMSQMVASGTTLVYTVPSFIEAWSDDEENVRFLKGLKAVMFAGAPLSKTAGDFLHGAGVKLICCLGSTECAQSSVLHPETYPEGYEWISFHPEFANPHFEPQEGDNTYELIFKQVPGHHPSAINTTVDGVPAYASNDLAEQHPTNKNLWRITGRKDDQIMLSIGEKTNPGPIETLIRKNKHVKGAVVFGRGRLQNGVIIEPESWEDFPTPEMFRDAAWPSIEEANSLAPSHSRIFKEMVLVASKSKPFQYTLKATPRRPPVLKEYEPEIEELYIAVKESSQIDIPAPISKNPHSGWSVDDTVDFVRTIVLRVMKNGSKLGINDDFFEFGCDSLEATYIRNTILRGLRESAPLMKTHKLPSNFVYEHPSIQKLGAYVARVSGGTPVTNGNSHDIAPVHARQLDEMVHKYAKGFPIHTPSTEATKSEGEVILLTGSTGGLGSQVLERLLALPSISKVYAFNRASSSGTTSLERQRVAFLDRENDTTLLKSKKLVFVEGDLGTKGFGISEKLLNEIRCSVTTIIHIAWQVDFKIMLHSFEPALRGVRNIIDLALSSPRNEPPRIVFTSTIGILRNWIPDSIPEAPISDSDLIMNTGYGESKWVSERILLEAAATTPLKPVIVRVGQLSGGLNGCWNVQEWFPSLVRGSQVIGCVPHNEGLASWIPLEVAASALVELRKASFPVTHLVHPRPVPWNNIAKHVAESLGVPLVSYSEWVLKLQKKASQSTLKDISENPALRLFEFYQESTAPSDVSGLEDRETLGLATLETRKTVLEAPSLGPKTLAQLGRGDVEKWMSYWRKKGLLK